MDLCIVTFDNLKKIKRKQQKSKILAQQSYEDYLQIVFNK